MTSDTSGAGVDGEEATGVSLPLLLDLVVAMVQLFFMIFFSFRSDSFTFIKNSAVPFAHKTPARKENLIYSKLSC